MRVLAITILLLTALAWPASADTAAGVAAYDEGRYQQAIELLRPEAENGDAVAQVKLGLIYAKGLGVPRDPAMAVSWFRKSAGQGNAEAQYCLGVAYDLGDTGAVDPEQAQAWYRKSADQGYVRAQYNLGHLLLNGAAVEKHEEGADFILKAAEQDFADAMHVYGNACGAGRGVEQNLLCARYWLRRAVDKGATKAQENLGIAEGAIRELETTGVPRTAGGEGSTMERAIILPDARTEFEGVKSEHGVAAAYFPGWRWGTQSVGDKDGRVFDAIELAKDGRTRTIYFDITNWYGKLD